MDAGATAVLGAAIGALGGLSGGWLTLLGQTRQQDRQREDAQQRWRSELRADAYRTCIAHAKALSAAWWKTGDILLEEASTADQWQAAFIAAHDAWTEFSTSVAAVMVAGPAPVAEAADQLRGALSSWETIGTAWYKEACRRGTGTLPDFADRFKDAAIAKRDPDRAFQQAARTALGNQ